MAFPLRHKLAASITGGALLVVALLVAAVLFLSLGRHDYNLGSAVYVATTEALEPLLCAADDSTSEPNIGLAFTDATARLGKLNTPRTFSLTAADVSGDGWDDIIIGTHNGRPQLLINTGSKFRNESGKLRVPNANIDWHGINAVDIDNDGRLDLAIAGGGADGVGKGSANAVFRNITQRDTDVGFQRIDINARLAAPAARTRAFIPFFSREDKSVNLYSTALHRENYPNRVWELGNAAENLGLTENSAHWLNGSYNDHGRGVIADFDGDDNPDYLVINNSNAAIFWANQHRKPSLLATYALSAAAGDLNNDGLLDIYIGKISPDTLSDQVSSNGERIHYVIHQNQRVDHSTLSFKSQLSTLSFDLKQNIPQGQRQYPGNGRDIFLGRSRNNPGARRFTLNKDDAIGIPDNFRKSGIYIWYSDTDKRWNMRWQFQNYASVYKGAITGSPVSDITTTGLTIETPDTTFDTLLINQGSGRFKRICATALSHTLTTSSISIADFDNDGWLDVAGARRPEQGGRTGEVFLLRNSHGKNFEKSVVPQRQEDLLFRPDLIVHGFFNHDNSPDLTLTYGFGQLPGTGGSPRLLLNENPRGYHAMVIDLQGSPANTFGVGAALYLRDSSNRLIGSRIAGLNTNISQDTQLVHFGLGESSPPYQLQVVWPDNSESNHALLEQGYHKVKQPDIESATK